MRNSDADDRASEQAMVPAEAFSLLGDEVRIEIIAALDETRLKRVSFSELYDRVELDDSGQFNYHLSKLVDHFVSKTDGGYQLTAAGERLARAVAAGLYTDSPEFPPFEVRGTCIACAEPALEAAYADEQFTITCGACDHRMLGVSAPPSLVRGRSPEEALAAFEEWSFLQVEQARAGICPSCGGSMDQSVTRQTPDGLPFDVLPELTCGVCGRRVVTSFAAVARGDPTVEAFRDRHDLDYRSRPYWELDEYVSDEHLELLSESPFRMQLTLPAADRVCEVVIDGSLDIVRTTVRKTDA